MPDQQYPVSNATNTLEQAQAMNAAYLAGVPYIPGNYVSPQQDAYNEAVKHYEAFSQPRTDTAAPSQAFQDIQQQYANRYGITTAAGFVQQQGPTATNPYNPNTAAGIAWEVARGGGATDTRLNQIATAEVVRAGGDPGFIRYATDIYQERPSFAAQTLTAKTGEQFYNPAWSGVPIRQNMTLAEMRAGGGVDTSGRFYQYNPETFMLNKITSPVEIGVDTGVHKRFGDFGGPILQSDGSYGGWRPPTPAGELVRHDTTSQMLGAVPSATYIGDTGGLPKPFISASTGIREPTGNINAFGFSFNVPGLAYFQPRERVTTTINQSNVPEVTTLKETRYTPTRNGMLTEQVYETTGGTIGTSKTMVAPVAGSSGWDRLQQGIRDTLRLPTPEAGERAMEFATMGNLALPTGGGFLIGQKIATGAGNYLGFDTTAIKMGSELTQPLRGQYTQFYEQPLLTPTSYAIGGLFGAGAKVLETGYMAGRGALAERIVSQGQTGRALEQVGATVMGRAPQILTGLYAADIAGRSTRWGTDLSPEAVSRAKGLTLQEAGAMTLGFGAPEAIYKSARLSDIGYKSALQEGTTTGRLNYYVTEPITSRVSTHISDASEFISGVRAAGGSVPVEAARLAQYKIGSAYELGIKQPAQAFAQELPGRAKGVAEAVYSPYFNTKLEVTSGFPSTLGQAPKYAESTRGYFDYVGIERRAYPEAQTPLLQTAFTRARTAAYDVPDMIRMEAKNIASGRNWGTPAPEYNRPFVEPENEFAFQYEPPTGSEAFQKTIGRILPPSTFGETKPLFAMTGGVGKGSEPYGERRGGGGGDIGSRVTTTRTIGGRTTSTLAKEPSLKSMGISEKAFVGETKGFAESKAIDYRGRATSETMKPMRPESYGYQGKKASGGQELLTEQLPRVEGMTEGRVAPQERYAMAMPFSIPMLGQQQSMEIVQTVRPSLEFTQERRASLLSAQLPQLDISFKSAFDVAQGQRSAKDIMQRSREDTLIAQIPRMAFAPVRDLGRESVRAQDVRFDMGSIYGQTQRITPSIDTTFRQTSRQTTTQDITTTEIPRFPIPLIIPPPLPGFPALPSSIPGGGSLRGFRKFTEYLSFGGLGWSGKMSVGTNARRIHKLKARKKK